MASKKTPPATDSLDGVVDRNKTSKPIGADKEIAARAKARAEQTIKEVQIQTTLQQLADASVTMNDSLAQLSSKLLSNSQELVKIQEAIDVKREEHQSLFDKEVIARELDQLIAHYEAKRLEFAAQEKADKQRWQEESEIQRRQRAQEEETYRYARDRDRRTDEDAWLAQKAGFQRQEDIRREELARQWARKEEDIAARAKGFDEELQKLKGSQEAQIQAITRNLAADAKQAKTEADGRLALVQQELASMRQLLGARDAEIVDLRAARSASEVHVRDIAMRGLETASSKMQFAEGALVSRGNEGNGTVRKPS